MGRSQQLHSLLLHTIIHLNIPLSGRQLLVPYQFHDDLWRHP